uniref:N(6)-L-threonylcarbamoyladenine synthase n=1 Tax=Heterorhabditis bacteriophora TaxID=37862 RepID=A0A1I7XIK7_HETBA
MNCDDSAVAIVQEDKRILASRNFADRELQRHLGGICPASVAQQHKVQLPVLLDECLFEAGLHFCDIDAFAVTTKPGLVIALKEGIRKAIELARIYHKDLIPVHHMQAHALSAFLVSDDLSFPFLTLLISGGHSLIVLVKSSENFIILGKSLSGSAGECMDKVARELNIQYKDDFKNIHPGAALEILARSSTEIHRYPKLPDTIYAHARFDIGIDERHSIPPKPIYKLKGSTVHGDTPLKLYSKSDFKK